MTDQKKLKQRVRSRMARTGESYMVARRRVVPSGDLPVSAGLHPDTSCVAVLLDGAGIVTDTGPLSEAMVLCLGGGLGAGYILWEFKAGAHKAVATGFRKSWQYPDRWIADLFQRLDVSVSLDQTASERKATGTLNAALDSRRYAMCWVNAPHLPYLHLDSTGDGWWGYPITVLGRADNGRLSVEDRNTGSLTISAEELAAARGRISSYKNRLLQVTGDRRLIETEQLLVAARGGLEAAVDHLGSKSTSFSLPAFRKWARLVDSDGHKGWRNVFADRRGLWGVLRSTYEATTEAGMLGGSLRALFADGLGEIAAMSGEHALNETAALYREAEQAWRAVGAAAIDGFEPLSQAAALARQRRNAIRQGDFGSGQAAALSAELHQLDNQHEPTMDVSDSDLSEILTALSGALTIAYQVEQRALESLGESATGQSWKEPDRRRQVAP